MSSRLASVAPAVPAICHALCDYEGWLRGELRAWGEGLLLGDETLTRGIFDEAMVRSFGGACIRALSRFSSASCAADDLRDGVAAFVAGEGRVSARFILDRGGGSACLGKDMAWSGKKVGKCAGYASVSVIIPTFNVRRYLRTIDSVWPNLPQ